jgi:FtsH-binding integral membrane protein
MLEVKKPTSALEKNEENIGSQENSHDSGNESNELPVEIKAQEQNYHIDESEGEISEEAIQMQVRAGFIRKVYGILSIQLIITFGAVFLFQIPFFKSFVILHQSLAGNMLILTSLAFMTLFLILVCNKNIAKQVPCNYIYLFAITLCESVACGIISSLYSFQIVATALALTIITTLAITFYACTTKTNFSYCRMGMYIAFSQLFFVGLIAVLFRIEALYTLYTFLMTIMVGMYLVYDTQLIMGKFGVAYSVDDYIFATLEIYMDIIRLFLLILRIVAKAQRRN